MLVIVSGFHSKRMSAFKLRLLLSERLVLFENELLLPCVKKVSEAVMLCESESLCEKRTLPPNE